MFQNSCQSTSFFELFDAKNIKERERPIFRVLNPNSANKVFDKTLKGYIFQLEGTSNRMVFPREEKQDLYLIQPFVVLQLYVQPHSSFSLEFIISDMKKTKRRIIFTQNIGKPERKPFFIKMTTQLFRKGRWLNLCINIQSFMAAFKGQDYRSLDQIYISGACKIKRIYTTQSPLIDIEGEDDSSCEKSMAFLPKHFSLPPGIPYSNQSFALEDFLPESRTLEDIEDMSDIKNNESSSNLSNVHSRFRDTRKQFSTPKAEPLKSSSKLNKSIQKKFLANTNSTEMMMRNRRQEEANLQKKLLHKQHDKPPRHTGQKIKQTSLHQRTQLTTTTKTNSQLEKTKVSATSIEKKTVVANRSPGRKRDKLEKTKLNPWRPEPQKPKQQEQEVKQEIQIDDRDVKSANTTVFKKNNLGNRQADPKLNTNTKLEHNNYSDSEYFQLSQKFSTITDPKFFKPQIIHRMSENLQEAKHHNYKADEEEEIEEAIEMEANSMHESNKLGVNQKSFVVDKRSSVHQDSQRADDEDEGMQTQEGFMQQHLKRMIGELDRPYTPPIHSHQIDKIERKPSNEGKEIEVFYDAVLGCYYDFKTNTYYELKPEQTS